MICSFCRELERELRDKYIILMQPSALGTIFKSNISPSHLNALVDPNKNELNPYTIVTPTQRNPNIWG